MSKECLYLDKNLSLVEKINIISEASKNQFKPDLVKYGKNFRAISESAVLEVLNPLLKKYNLAYSVEIVKSELRVEKVNLGTNADGALIQKLLFVADCVVGLKIGEEIAHYDPISNSFSQNNIYTEGWGSGIDEGDKATGKALTAAVKYALFKVFRLQYSDDPDAKVSEEIIDTGKTVAKPKEKVVEKEEEKVASEKMINFIKSLCITCNMSDEDFKKEYKYYPYDEKMPMRVAREAIDKLKAGAGDKLPF